MTNCHHVGGPLGPWKGLGRRGPEGQRIRSPLSVSIFGRISLLRVPQGNRRGSVEDSPVNKQAGVEDVPEVTSQRCGRPTPGPALGQVSSRPEWRKLSGSWLGGYSMWNTNTHACLGLRSPQPPKPLPPWWPQAAVGVQSWVRGQARYWPQSKSASRGDRLGERWLEPALQGQAGNGSRAWTVEVQRPQQRPAAGALPSWWGWRPPGQVPEGLRDAAGGPAC